ALTCRYQKGRSERWCRWPWRKLEHRTGPPSLFGGFPCILLRPPRDCRSDSAEGEGIDFSHNEAIVLAAPSWLLEVLQMPEMMPPAPKKRVAKASATKPAGVCTRSGPGLDRRGGSSDICTMRAYCVPYAKSTRWFDTVPVWARLPDFQGQMDIF